MGEGWGNARPGSGRRRLSPAPGRGSRGRARGAPRGAGSGMSGPWAGDRARTPLTRRSGLSRGHRSSSGWVPGSRGCGRLRPPWPGPAASRRPVSGPRGPRAASCRRRGPWSRAAPGGRAGPGGRADPRTGGPMDHSAAASLPRYGASEGQARPARPRARPRGPRLQRARTRRAPLPSAPAGGQARRSEGIEVARDQRGSEEIGKAHPRGWIWGPDRGGCGVGWSANSAKRGPGS